VRERPVPNIVATYAIKQRQGFIPNMHKPNQDAFVCQRNFAGIENLWLFGVCDGHGANGHLVSDFVKKTLPKLLAGYIQSHLGMKVQTTSKPLEHTPLRQMSIKKG
jgi:serine/threonine protein phosphatase PrpC